MTVRRFELDRRRALALGAAAGFARPARAKAPEPPWEALERQLPGIVARPNTPLEDCVRSGGGGAEALFGETLKNPFAISDEPGLTQTLAWTDAWRSAPSARVARVRDAQQVAACVDFARKTRTPLVVRGGAHSYFGASNRAGALMVWTQGLDAVTLLPAFTPAGAPAGRAPERAVAVGAGALWGDVYGQVMHGASRYVQGGGCLSVGVAGFTLGGGFGSFSKAFGTGAANLLEAEVVTGDGRARTVNARQDPDLFFALRGGGGSFGVVTRLVLRTHPLPQSIGAALFEVKAKDAESFRTLTGAMVDHYAERLFNPHWGEQIRFTPDHRLIVSMVGQGRGQAEVEADWAPFLAWLRSRGDDYALQGEPMIAALPGHAFYNPAVLRRIPGLVTADGRPGARANRIYWTMNAEEAGQQIYAYKSRWLPKSLLEPGRRGRLADALVKAAQHWSVTLHVNKGLAGGDPDAIARTRETAMNPQVCDAFALLITAATDGPAWPGVPGHAPDEGEARRQAARVDEAYAAIAAVSPGAGCYMSEADWFDTGWREHYWGPHYPRLLAIKRRYDPAALFGGHNMVGG